MKIKSEYNYLAECVENGAKLGFYRAHKHTHEPSDNDIINAVADAVMLEISEVFYFDNEHRND